jgi:alkylhydroperoxidase family enzyme
VHHHGAGLRTILSRDGVPSGAQEEMVANLQISPLTASHLSANELALLAYADLLTQTPWKVTRADIDALRAGGYEDRAIHDVCAIISYFAFVNRIANGLGVELEGHDPAD